MEQQACSLNQFVLCRPVEPEVAVLSFRTFVNQQVGMVMADQIDSTVEGLVTTQRRVNTTNLISTKLPHHLGDLRAMRLSQGLHSLVVLVAVPLDLLAMAQVHAETDAEDKQGEYSDSRRPGHSGHEGDAGRHRCCTPSGQHLGQSPPAR
jgi:hypothetical protein